MKSSADSSPVEGGVRPHILVEGGRGAKVGIHLTQGRRGALDKVAKGCGVACKGVDGSVGRPGWRALVLAIADGRLKVLPVVAEGWGEKDLGLGTEGLRGSGSNEGRDGV